MNLNLQWIFDFVNFVGNKAQEGNTISRNEFNTLLQGFNISVFNSELKKVEEIAKTNGGKTYEALSTSSLLRPFSKVANLQTDTFGVVAKPPMYARHISATVFYNNELRKIDFVSDEKAIDIRTSSLETPLDIRPICVAYGTTLQFWPKDVGNTVQGKVELSYLRTPVTPVYDRCVSVNTGIEYYMPAGTGVDLSSATNGTLRDGDDALLVNDVVTVPGKSGIIGNKIMSETVELEYEQIHYMDFAVMILEAMGVNTGKLELNQYAQQLAAK